VAGVKGVKVGARRGGLVCYCQRRAGGVLERSYQNMCAEVERATAEVAESIEDTVWIWVEGLG
jgi:hypothetical protein